jgi:pimeloyl-ACP methyl ester carboxylesterase
MSRFHGPNKEYSATLQLSARQRDEGGDVQNPFNVIWKGNQPITQLDLVVLIHGFNNHVEEAQTAYLGFRRRQSGFLSEGDAERLELMLGDVFWPGDADWGLVDILDALYYPKTIAKARATAGILADYLVTRTDVHNLSFIGHSMGCRVVLETIKELKARNHPTPIRKVCLMAAAVPTYFVFPPDGSLDAALHAADQSRMLFSPDDGVLAWAFGPGQTLAGEGFFPTAIGRYGDVPLSPGKVDRIHIQNAGHSDYWGHKDDAPSGASATELSKFLAIGRQLQTVRATPPPPQREGPRPRAQPARRIGHP